MPKDVCPTPQKLLPCPVTQAVQTEGAYPILQDIGNIWYCTNCFYCEDACPTNSARQYAIEKRRAFEQSSKNTTTPLEQLKQHGTLFPINAEIATLRSDEGLPLLPEKPITELAYLYEQVMTGAPAESFPSAKKTATPKIQPKNLEHTIALFLGCLIPYRVLNYEKSARQLLKRLDVIACDLPFACCGSVMTESQSEDLWLVSAAYNLAIAEEAGLTTIISLCGGCTGNLRRVNQKLLAQPALLSKVNSYLAKINKQYSGNVRVWHLSEFLHNAYTQQNLHLNLNTQQNETLTSLVVGTQVPCQVIRPLPTSPNAIHGSNLLRDLLSLTAIQTIHYPFETMCCGSSMLLYNREIAYAIAKKRIAALKKRAVDALVLGCGNCSMIYTIHQSEYSPEPLQTFFFTEILDYALGGENEELTRLISSKKS